MININKLSSELKQAQIAFSGCNEAGVVWDLDGTTEIQARPDVATVLAVHDPDDNWDKIRLERNRRLSACDWTQAQDAALTEAEKIAWCEYRQALRNIPQSFEKPDDVIWPVMP